MIFCVEDDSNIRELVVYTLESTGFQARGFEDGSSFLEALALETPELVLLDIMLPQINIEEMANQPSDDDDAMDEERDEETAYTEDDIDLEDLYSRYALHYPEESAQTEPDKKE